jgi:FKBP-type peptidyl-prolyl cis-trans isomerase
MNRPRLRIRPTLALAAGLVALPACEPPAMTRTLPPGVEPVRQTSPDDAAEAIGEMSTTEALQTQVKPKINLAIIPAEPTEPGKPAEMLNGLKYETLKPGSGEQVKAGQTAKVHYVGTLTDGTVFDSSRQRGEPFSFVIGAGEVIEGWERGIAGMKVGELRKLSIPPDLAYKSQGKGTIPPNSTLLFEVELLGVEGKAPEPEPQPAPAQTSDAPAPAEVKEANAESRDGSAEPKEASAGSNEAPATEPK